MKRCNKKNIGQNLYPGLFFFSVFSFFLLPFHSAEAADIQITAGVDRAEVTLEDEIRLTITVEGRTKATEPLLPSIPAFKIVQFGSTSSIQLYNGSLSFKKQFAYILVPQEEGSFTLEPATVFAGGQEYKSNAITITVKAAGAITHPVVPVQPFDSHGPDQNQPVQNPDASTPYWISAKINKKNPYVHEQILYTFQFYTRVNVGAATLTLPEFRDFWSEEVVPEKKYTTEISGTRYVVSEKVIALYPLKSGNLTIDKTELRVEVPDDRFSGFFNDSFFSMNAGQTRPKNLGAKAIQIEVRALPGEIPANYTNLVGKFDLVTHLSHQEIKMGDSATLEIRITGRGNIKDAILPQELEIPNFKIYEDKPVTDTQRTDAGIEGTKVFKRALVPSGPGSYELPPLVLTYFDPEDGAFKSLASTSLLLAVKPSGDESSNLVATDLDDKKNKNRDHPGDEGIAPIHLQVGENGATLQLLASPKIYFLFLLIFPVVYLLVFVWWKKRQHRLRNLSYFSSQEAYKIFLSKLRRQPDRGDTIFEAIKIFMGSRTGLYGRALTIADIVHLLKDRKVDKLLIDRLEKLMRAMEAEQYGGVKGADLVLWRNEALELCKQINKKIFCFIFAGLVLIGSLVVPAAHATPDDDLLKADQAYGSGNLQDAENIFERLLQEMGPNADLYYNLANVYYRQNRLGQAVLGYEKALLIHPRDADLRANLALIRGKLNADLEEESLSSRLVNHIFVWVSYLSLAELMLLFGLVWCLFWLVGLTRIFVFKGRLGFIFWLLLLFLLAMGGSLWLKYDLFKLNIWGILLKPEVNVWSSFLKADKALLDLPEATKVLIVSQQPLQGTAAWYQIRLPQGKKGWIIAEDVGLIE